MSLVPGHPRISRGFRSGIVIGVALAMVGIVVGTATGATTTPFQQVLVVNAPSSPIPVAQQGAISISNLPSNQSVTVSNFPATQPVSGTVSVDNLPDAQLASKSFIKSDSVGNDGGFETYSFGRTINVSNLFVSNQDSDSMAIYLVFSNGASSDIWAGDGNFQASFPTPVPMTGVQVFCYNLVLDCHFTLTAVGS